MLEEKFIPPFIDFINNNFNEEEHLFVFLGQKRDKYGEVRADNIVYISKKANIFKFFKFLYQAEKIIIHGLWFEHLNKILFLNPWLYKKCYWVMWGGDFYFPNKQSWFQKQSIKRVGHLITYVKGDYELAQKQYSAKGKYHECFMYPSNLYKSYDLYRKEDVTITIQIGNSSDPTNNHLDIFAKLNIYKDHNIKIYAPLSYGDDEYAKRVIEKGKTLFGDKFIPLTEFIPFEEYLKFLADIDIAIFAHDRQQAMGNAITLLGLGKKVYMRSDVTQWNFFQDLGVKVFDFNQISLEPLNEEVKKENQEKIKKYFSKKNYIMQLIELFK